MKRGIISQIGHSGLSFKNAFRKARIVVVVVVVVVVALFCGMRKDARERTQSVVAEGDEVVMVVADQRRMRRKKCRKSVSTHADDLQH